MSSRSPDPDEFIENLVGGVSSVPVGPVALWRRWWNEHDLDDPVVAASSRHGFVLSTRELRALGISRESSRWAVKQGRWTVAGRGVLAPIDVRRSAQGSDAEFVIRRRMHALRTGAAMVSRPGDAACSRSAAVLHGLPTYRVPLIPDLSARREGGMGRRRSTHLLAGTLDLWEMTTWFGLDVASVARTLVDLGRLDRRDAIIAGDAALRERIVTRPDIDRSLQLARGWPGIVQAREILDLLDARSESPLESFVRLRLHDDGFPRPELQHWLGRDRVDFFWPELGFVLEADGRQKYADEGLWEEKQREQRVRRHHVRVERITWAEADGGWDRYSRFLRSAMSWRRG